MGLGLIWILAICTYSSLFPLQCSPLSSSLHLMLWVPIEKSLLLSPPLLYFLLSPSFTTDLLALLRRCHRNVFSLPRSLTSIHSGCTLNFDRTTEVAGQHWGKGGVEGWREQGGVGMSDSGRWSAGLDSRHKTEVFPQSRSGKRLIQNQYKKANKKQGNILYEEYHHKAVRIINNIYIFTS